MKTIATLGPSVRLIVLQFLMKSAQVPAIISPKRHSKTPAISEPRISGVRVLESTPKLNIFPLASKIAYGREYELVDVWQNPHETNWNMSFVRFVFCHKKHLNPISSDFVNKRDSLEKALVDLVSKNLWAVQGHLNPYFGKKEGKPGDHKVLMFGCAGRVPDTEVYSGGRDENNRGVGPKVSLVSKALRIEVAGDKVVFADPQKPDSFPNFYY